MKCVYTLDLNVIPIIIFYEQRKRSEGFEEALLALDVVTTTAYKPRTSPGTYLSISY